MKSGNPSNKIISCKISLLQNIFNPFSRLFSTITLIIIGVLFIVLPIANIIIDIKSIISWSIGIIFIPMSLIVFLRPKKIFILYNNLNPVLIEINENAVLSRYADRDYKRPRAALRIKKGLFGACIIRDSSGYCDVVVSATEISFDNLKELISNE
jgi:hypothetical protein